MPANVLTSHSFPTSKSQPKPLGEDVDVRRKFIEDNALDVKNLDV